MILCRNMAKKPGDRPPEDQEEKGGWCENHGQDEQQGLADKAGERHIKNQLYSGRFYRLTLPGRTGRVVHIRLLSLREHCRWCTSGLHSQSARR